MASMTERSRNRNGGRQLAAAQAFGSISRPGARPAWPFPARNPFEPLQWPARLSRQMAVTIHGGKPMSTRTAHLARRCLATIAAAAAVMLLAGIGPAAAQAR